MAIPRKPATRKFRTQEGADNYFNRLKNLKNYHVFTGPKKEGLFPVFVRKVKRR